MFEIIKDLAKDNPEALAEITTATEAINTANATVTATQTKLTDSITSRDKAKNENLMFRSKFNVANSQEINDEVLDAIGLKEGEDITVLKAEFAKQIDEMTTNFNTKETELNESMNNTLMEKDIAQASVGAGLRILPAHLVKSFNEIVSEGRSRGEDGNITYLDTNGVQLFTDGKPMTVSDRIAKMKSNEDYDDFFNPVTKDGTNGTGGDRSGGVAKTMTRESFNQLSDNEKASFFPNGGKLK